MKLKKFSALSSALILALASLFSLAFGGIAHAAGTTLYWCEFSTNSDFNTASNWNTNSDCSSGTQEVPASGDALVFDNSSLSSGTEDINNDISGLDISSITFQGSGNGGYTLTGDTISLDSGISDIGTGSGIINTISSDITLTASQTFDTSQGTDYLMIDGTVNIGTNNLTLSGAGENTLSLSTISGSGTLTLSSPPGGSSIARYYFSSASGDFSGPIVIDANAVGVDGSNTFNALGSGLVTVNSGGALELQSSSNSGTFSSPLILVGSGNSSYSPGAILSCLGEAQSCEGDGDNTTLTLSGNITLSGDAQLVNGAYYSTEPSPPTHSATINLTGNITYGGFTLTAVPNSNTIVNFPGAAGSSSKSAPKAPDTGLSLAGDHFLAPLFGAVLIIVALVIPTVVFRKTNKSTKS